MREIVKRLLENHRLTEMALEKSAVERRIEAKGEDICDHIMKAVIYKNRTNDLYHWLYSELSSKFAYISRMDIKTKTGKLKENVYRSLIFGYAGENEHDSKTNLIGFRIDYVQSTKDPYPDFEITEDLVRELRIVMDSIINTICPMLAERTHYSQDDFYRILKDIIH